MLALSLVLHSGRVARAQSDPSRQVLLAALHGATIRDLLATPEFRALAGMGGAALLVMTDPGSPLQGFKADLFVSPGQLPSGVRALDLGAVTDASGTASRTKLAAAADLLASILAESTATNELVLLASTSADASAGRLGAVVMIQGSPADMAAAIRKATGGTSANTLTSDSTHRPGVVASPDLAQTTIEFADLRGVRDPGGAEIHVIDEPPPVDLYDRYLESRRLTVPIGTAAALYAVIGSLIGIVALGWRRSPPMMRTIGAWVAISSPFLALSLLLVGHLSSLTYATVIPLLAGATGVGTIALVPVVRRWGTLGAIGAAGGILLTALAIEAALGWTAALTPLLGGSQLDGGRFFGLPNAFIGLLLGGSVYVAQRLPRASGAVLIAAVGLFAGSPWTGSNIGAAVTLFAAAGIWWGLRADVVWWRTVASAAIAVAVGTLVVVFAHRVLTSAPTHITRFSEDAGGLSGVWDTFVHRISVGADLIASNPFALLPVLGVLATLAVVWRPPSPVRRTLEEAPVWRMALLTILVASVIAYAVEDSGAAAVGEGFTTSLAGLLYVSLLRRNDIMETR